MCRVSYLQNIIGRRHVLGNEARCQVRRNYDVGTKNTTTRPCKRTARCEWDNHNSHLQHRKAVLSQIAASPVRVHHLKIEGLSRSNSRQSEKKTTTDNSERSTHIEQGGSQRLEGRPSLSAVLP